MYAVDELANHPGTTAKIVATPAEVAALLRRAHQAGRLLTMTPPRPAGGGQVVVDVQLRPLARSQTIAARAMARRWTRRRIGWTAAAAAAGVGAVVALAVWLVQWLLANPAAVAAGLLLTGALAAAAKRARQPAQVRSMK